MKYTKSYADTIGKDKFLYLDTSTGTAEPRSAQALYNEGFAKRKILTDGAEINKFSIPLNSYNYFAAFKNNLQPNIKTNIILRLQNDNNLIFRNAGAPDSKVILTKLRLWVPKIIFNGRGIKEYVENYLKPKKWTYLREHHEIKQSGASNDSFRISTGIRRPRHVFIWAVPTLSYNNQGANIFTFALDKIGGNSSFSRAQLEINNSMYYPQLEMTGDEMTRLYRELMSFSFAYNDFLSGPLIDRTNFKNLFGILYFNLRNQDDDVKNSVVSLTFRYQLSVNPAGNYTMNALVLHEKEIELYTSSGKLLIKA